MYTTTILNGLMLLLWTLLAYAAGRHDGRNAGWLESNKLARAIEDMIDNMEEDDNGEEDET